MKTEVNPQDTNRAEAFELWMSSPMPMVTLTKTFDVSNLLCQSLIFMKKSLQIICIRYITGVDSAFDIVYDDIYCNAIVLKQLAILRKNIEFL